MQTNVLRFTRRLARAFLYQFFFTAFLLGWLPAPQSAAQNVAPTDSRAKKLELSRPVRPWEFVAAAGKRAGLLGNESGKVEAWVYPLKILRDLQLTILTDGREIPAETLVRTVIARPESTTLVYAGDTFSIRETFFVPVGQAGGGIEVTGGAEQTLGSEGG